MERTLFALLTVTMLGLLAALNAWRRQLIPWATEVGTVAEWVGALGAAGAIFWAVYVFNRQQEREALQQEREAQKLVTVWRTSKTPDSGGSDTEQQQPWERELIATVHNFGTGPVRNVSLLLDLPSKNRGWSEVSGELRRNIPFIAPAASSSPRFGVNQQYPFGLWSLMYTDDDNDDGLAKYTVLEYTDGHGTKWISKNGVARRAPLDQP